MAAAARLIPGFEAQSALEQLLAGDPVMLKGLAWGKPREGHPEGSVGAHVADLLDTVDAWGEEGLRRAELRLVVLVHDTLKGEVKEWRPRTGENHHAMRARRFTEQFTSDERLLATIELHDGPYSLWKRMRKTGDPQREAMDAVIERLPDAAFFLRFVELDGSSAGKNPAPVEWFRDELAARNAAD